MDYDGLSWTIMDYQGRLNRISWIIMEYHIQKLILHKLPDFDLDLTNEIHLDVDCWDLKVDLEDKWQV